MDPNERHPNGWLPLHVAAVQGHVKVCAILLEAGADIDGLDQYDPVHGGFANRMVCVISLVLRWD